MNQRQGLYEAAGRRRGEQRFLIVLGVLGMAMTLILGAFFIGRVFSDDVPESTQQRADSAGDGAADVEAGSLAEAALGGQAPPSPTPTQQETETPEPETGKLTGKAYNGPRSAFTPDIARASCRSEESVDAGGRRVAYSPMNIIDGSRASAWRCDGNGKGETVTFKLGGTQEVVALGIIPGYAKTDPVDGTDRYRENRRIKRVRWTFDGGRFIVQTFNHRPGNRDMQRIRIPAVKTGTIKLEILDSTRARRNTVAISKAWFSAADR